MCRISTGRLLQGLLAIREIEEQGNEVNLVVSKEGIIDREAAIQQYGFNNTAEYELVESIVTVIDSTPYIMNEFLTIDSNNYNPVDRAWFRFFARFRLMRSNENEIIGLRNSLANALGERGITL